MRSFAVSALVLALLIVLAATAIALVTLWPEGSRIESPLSGGNTVTRSARVVSVTETPCRLPGGATCRRVTAELTSGPERGERTSLVFGEAGTPANVDVGTRLRLVETLAPSGGTIGGVASQRYAFSDFERQRPLLLLVVAFALLVVATSRWQGVRSLIGLALSLGVVILFVVPAILEGESPLGVAITGALAVMFLTIPVTHGLGVKTLAACLGTSASLVLTLALANLFTNAAHLSGASSDEAAFLGALVDDISLQGLLLAGMVIAALGVLDDLTVSQASTVLALRRANPNLGWRALFVEATAVGRDHIAATVNTLVLAYVGASLPVLLVFGLAGTTFGEAVTSEIVAEQIVATLVGSIGLIAAVPITTGLAAFLAVRVSADRLESGHAHAH